MVSLPMHVSESGDEGLGSMSPEPLSVITVTTEGHSVVNNEVVELRRQLERERHARLRLEKQMRVIQNQLYPERFRDNQLITYQPHEVFYNISLHTHLYIASCTLCNEINLITPISRASLAPISKYIIVAIRNSFDIKKRKRKNCEENMHNNSLARL